METNDTDPTKASQLAQKIVNLLIDVDSGTRRRAIEAALTLLGEKQLTAYGGEKHRHPPADETETALDLGQFFNRGDKMRPSDNAQLCAAYHYALHGPAAFTLDDIRRVAAEAGVVLPDRLDMTFSSAKHAGKNLFQSAGRGMLKPTAAAGVAFNERWSVKPGRQAKTGGSDK